MQKGRVFGLFRYAVRSAAFCCPSMPRLHGQISPVAYLRVQGLASFIIISFTFFFLGFFGALTQGGTGRIEKCCLQRQPFSGRQISTLQKFEGSGRAVGQTPYLPTAEWTLNLKHQTPTLNTKTLNPKHKT